VYLSVNKEVPNAFQRVEDCDVRYGRGAGGMCWFIADILGESFDLNGSVQHD
jgi:hypothetical protein